MAEKPRKEEFKETDKPWERPGQSAQNPSEKPPLKADRQGSFEQINKTS
jgi:hypothetical protein